MLLGQTASAASKAAASARSTWRSSPEKRYPDNALGDHVMSVGAQCSAIARPMPRLAPVTRNRLRRIVYYHGRMRQ